MRCNGGSEEFSISFCPHVCVPHDNRPKLPEPIIILRAYNTILLRFFSSFSRITQPRRAPRTRVEIVFQSTRFFPCLAPPRTVSCTPINIHTHGMDQNTSEQRCALVRFLRSCRFRRKLPKTSDPTGLKPTQTFNFWNFRF